MNRINPKTSNTANIEAEINKLCQNWYIPKEDARLFVRLNNNNYYPVETYIDSQGNLVIEDDERIKGKWLHMGTNKQFIYYRYIIANDTNLRNFGTAFRLGWNPDNYIVFRNGYLMNPAAYKIKCPTLDNIYTYKTLYSFVKLKKDDRLDIFYIESPDGFKGIRFNQDIYTRSIRVYAENDDQVVFEIPYPYTSYPREGDMFYVYDHRDGRYLHYQIEDYTITNNKQFIVVREGIKFAKGDYIVFVFPYCVTEFPNDFIDSVEEATDVVTFRSVGKSKSGNKIIFDPEFTDYTLYEGNCLVTYEDKVLDPYHYHILSNKVIQFDFSGTASKFAILALKEKEDVPDGTPNRLLTTVKYSVTPVVYKKS